MSSLIARVGATCAGVASLAVLGVTAGCADTSAAGSAPVFRLEEATIAEIQQAILSKQITSTELVTLYLNRIKAYNGTCVQQPDGILGVVETIPHAGQINALSTLNLRPAALKSWGFDERKARSMTDAVDADPNMPDALEIAAAQDAEFARTGQLVGPLHGVVMAIKDQYDTFDMRTTSGADAFYANDRPPDDSTFVDAAARRRRDHSRQGQHGRVRVGHAAQLVRRHVLQPLRHGAHPARLELGIRLRRGRQPRDVRDRRGVRLVDPRPGQRGEHRRHRGDRGAREPRRNDPDRHQHARRPDLPHGRGRRQGARRDCGL